MSHFIDCPECGEVAALEEVVEYGFCVDCAPEAASTI